MTRPAVLVVEDEPHICELISDILEDGGYQAICATSDTEALEALQERRTFACAVVDVNLRHGVTGYDVARFARTLDEALPVLFVSGEIAQGSVAANGVPGALFAQKPFTAEELMAKVHMLVGDNDDQPVG